MMELSFLEEFKRSWLTSIIGFLLLCCGSWILTWNEGRAVHHAHALDEAYENVISLNPYEPVRAELNNSLVHISGNLLIDEPLTEPEYGISVQAVKLKRRVQMYQWVEQTGQRDFGDTLASERSGNDYYYVSEWRDKLVDSRSFYIRFGHQNPIEMPLHSNVQISPFVRVNQLIVGWELKQKFNDFIEFTGDERPERRDIKLHMGIYYHCDDVWNPEIGDIRVQFYYCGVNGEPVTIVAKQVENILVPYVTKKGSDINLLRHGILNVSQMFQAEHSDAHWKTWKLRAAGMFILYVSSVCLAKFLRIILLRIPVLSRLVVNDITSSINFGVAASVSLLIISIAWILYRPMIGMGLVVASISPLLYFSMTFVNRGQNENEFRNR